MTLRIGSLCTGYGGLEMGVQAVMGGDTAWVSDIDKGACKILAHRFPGVPNIGDMTRVDWSQVEPVDLICGGTPCQDLSHAGKRAGMSEGTRSNLWVAMREAIAVIRPAYVIWENVRGAYSAAADSELEHRVGLLGDRPGRPILRALGRVLGDLASLGYDASWHGLRAADVGAPHNRFRVFVIATDTDSTRRGGFGREQSIGRDADRCDRAHGPRATDQPTALFRTPTAQLAVNGGSQHPEKRKAGGHGPTLADEVEHLLPTPSAIDGGGGPKRIRKDGRTEADHGPALRDLAPVLLPTPAIDDTQRLLPTPKTIDRSHVHTSRRARDLHSSGDSMADVIDADQWGRYGAAVERWESCTRSAPSPTELGPKGSRRLSARFSEWLMGVPDGWITDVPGITRNEALKACGNGVVPQQAAAALSEMLTWQVAS